MWKLILGFIVFAALALFILSRGGDIDMSGEKHDVGASHGSETAASAASAPAAASAVLPASAASQ